MLSPDEVEATKRRNYHTIRELIRTAYTLGVNLMKPSARRSALKIINVILVVGTLISFYGHWTLFKRYEDSIPLAIETVSTFFQASMSVWKMTYFLFVQHKFYELLRQARSHELLQQCEIFQRGFPINDPLKKEIEAVMDVYWRKTRSQLVFYLSACVAIICNYCANSFGVNTYHYLKGTPDYTPEMPFHSHPLWVDKGMQFPYYAIEMFCGSCSVYIAGVCAFTFDTLYVILCMHCVGLMKSLVVMVSWSTSPQLPSEQRLEYLRCCIYQYQRTFDYALKLKNIIRHPILPQFLLSLMVGGLVLFNVSFGLEHTNNIILLRMIMYIAAAGYQIVIFCSNGQRFTSASEEIPDAFYNCAWYGESREFRQLVRMMIMCTSRPLYLEVSWFTTMSLPTLLAMVRASGSYFLLLRNVTEE